MSGKEALPDYVAELEKLVERMAKRGSAPITGEANVAKKENVAAEAAVSYNAKDAVTAAEYLKKRPQGLALKAMDEVIHREMKLAEEAVGVVEVIDCFPWDGAYALKQVLANMQGQSYLDNFEVQGMFGKVKVEAKEIAVETAPGVTTKVPWGRFYILGADHVVGGDPCNYFMTGITRDEGRVKFQLEGRVQRVHRDFFDAVAKGVREYVRTSSLYRGKTFHIRFRDDDGKMQPLPVPKMEPTPISWEHVVFSKELTSVIEDSILAPIIYREQMKQLGILPKRGALLCGPPGVGKTLLAAAISKIANEHGWTFVYVKRASELPDALAFSKAYGPCIVLVEDIDRVTAGNRTTEIDTILNTLDGINSKDSETFVIFTSNHPEVITEPMRRPGRIDVIIRMNPPDGEAVERLIRKCAGATLEENVELKEVGEMLKGHNPATIEEAVKRAQFSMVFRRKGDVGKLTEADLMRAALYVRNQASLFGEDDKVDPLYSAVNVLGGALSNGLAEKVGYVDRMLKDVLEKMS